MVDGEVVADPRGTFAIPPPAEPREAEGEPISETADPGSARSLISESVASLLGTAPSEAGDPWITEGVDERCRPQGGRRSGTGPGVLGPRALAVTRRS